MLVTVSVFDHHPRTQTLRNKEFFCFLRLFVFSKCSISSLGPPSFKTDHIKLSVNVPVIVLETNCITPNKADSHPFEFREEAQQPLNPLLVFRVCLCVCVYSHVCLCMWAEGEGRLIDKI